MAFEDVFGGLLGAGLNYFTDPSRKLSQQNLDLANQYDQKRQGAFNTYSGQLSGMLPELQAGYQPRGGTVTGGLATGTYDPTSGTTNFTLDPRVKSLMDQYLTGAQKQMSLAGSTDPQVLGQQRVDAVAKLMQPQRDAEQAKLMRDLQAKGLAGISTYAGSPTGTSQNPYMAAMQGARQQTDARTALDSLQMGEQYLNSLMSRSNNMLGGALGINSMGASTGQAAQALGNQLTQQQRAATDAQIALKGEAYKQQMMANAPSDRIFAAMMEKNAADASRKGGLLDALIPTGSKVLAEVLGKALGSNGNSGGLLEKLLGALKGGGGGGASGSGTLDAQTIASLFSTDPVNGMYGLGPDAGIAAEYPEFSTALWGSQDPGEQALVDYINSGYGQGDNFGFDFGTPAFDYGAWGGSGNDYNWGGDFVDYGEYL